MFKFSVHKEDLYRKIRVMANRNRFRVLELTQEKSKTVTELSKETNLAYNKCADYMSMLEKEGLLKKERLGREIMVKATIDLNKMKIQR